MEQEKRDRHFEFRQVEKIKKKRRFMILVAGGVTAVLFPVYFLQPSIKKINKMKNLACLPSTVATARIPAWKRSLF